jgi:hypothetical protein
VVVAESWAPRPTDDPVVVVKYAATAEFAGLSEERKAPYLRAIRDHLDVILQAAEEGRMTHEEQVEAVRNVVRSRGRLEMKEYAALPAGVARRERLDKLIDEQEQLRQRAKKVAAQSGRPVGPNPVMLKQFVETLAPEERIQMAGFVYDLVQRRRERGLPGWPFAEGEP